MKIYIFDSCCKSFSQEEDLNDHIHSVHVGQEDHGCDLCGISFSQEDELNDHFNTVHEGHRDHKCDSCGKVFSHANKFDSIMEGIKIVNSSELTLCHIIEHPFFLKSLKQFWNQNCQICKPCQKDYNKLKIMRYCSY